MKQILVKKGKVLISEIPVPAINPHDVLVEVAYSLISPGTELASLQRSESSLAEKVITNPGALKKAFQLVKTEGLGRLFDKVKQTHSGETAVGYSCSGRVIKVGDAVQDLQIGDEVACAGAGKANHAEYVAVPRHLVAKIPAGCSPRDAASVTLGAIALQGVRRAEARVGEAIAVIGLGLIGQLTAQLLKASGCTVICLDIDPARITIALAQGADHGLNPLHDHAQESIREFTAGAMADATIITADSPDSDIIQQAMVITRKKGTVVIVGAVGLNLQRSPFYQKEIDLRISCSYGPGRYDPQYEEQGVDYPLPYVRWTENRNMVAYLKLLAEKKIAFAALVGGEFPLEQATDAFSSLKRDGQQDGERPIAVLLRYAETQQSSPSPTVTLTSVPRTDVIRVGLIGTGSFATAMHLPNLKTLSRRYAIHAVAGRDGVKTTKIGKQYGAAYATTDYHEILDDPAVDMALICTRHHLHTQLALEALRAGKSVFLEKPLATTRRDFDAFKTYLEQTPRVRPWMVGFNRRFSPAAAAVKTLLAGRVNPAMLLYRVNAGYVPPDHWTQTDEGGGRIIGEACHMLDLFRFLIGHPPHTVDVSAISPATSHVSRTDNFTATVKFGDGSIGTLLYSALGSKEAEKETIEIFFDNKLVVVHDFSRLEVHGLRAADQRQGRADKGHLGALTAFERCLCDGEALPIPAGEILETTELAFRIDELVRGG